MQRFEIILTALLLAGIDQISKYWAEANLLPFHIGVPVIKHWLSFRLTKNTGVSFSLFADKPDLVNQVSLLLTGVIVAYVLLAPSAVIPPYGIWAKVKRSSLALLVGGAVGNVIDRVFKQGVIDFIDFEAIKHYPVFNLADCFVVLGVIGLVLCSLASPLPVNHVENQTK